MFIGAAQRRPAPTFFGAARRSPAPGLVIGAAQRRFRPAAPSAVPHRHVAVPAPSRCPQCSHTVRDRSAIGPRWARGPSDPVRQRSQRKSAMLVGADSTRGRRQGCHPWRATPRPAERARAARGTASGAASRRRSGPCVARCKVGRGRAGVVGAFAAAAARLVPPRSRPAS